MPRIAVIPGDGIGAEVTQQATKVLRCLAERSSLTLDITEFDFGAERYLKTGSAITEKEFEVLSRFDAIFLGALGDPRVTDHAHARAILLGIRFRFDLYINLRPVKLLDARLSPLRDVRPEDVDLVIVRENTEGIYLGLGGSFKRGTPDEVAIEEDLNTRRGVERIIRAAFDLARREKRRKVTLTDKANAMQHAGGLWRRVFAEVARDYADVQRDAVYIDALALDLIRRPAHYDVIVASNLFGDILSDLAAALAGGLGVAPSANLHPGRPGLFEPVHGSAPDLVGTGQANPLAAILTAALMLRELGHAAAAQAIEQAAQKSVLEGRTTPDLGGSLSANDVADWICDQLA
jgi:3-isopropylmalate dehydrogenase